MLDLVTLTKTVGYTGLFFITFAESGLLIGFFLPGDSLLFTAGFVASQGVLDIMILIPLLFLAAVTGDTVGYAFGYKIGPKLFKQKDSIMFSKKNLKKTTQNTNGPDDELFRTRAPRRKARRRPRGRERRRQEPVRPGRAVPPRDPLRRLDRRLRVRRSQKKKAARP
jgi:hypothetical protein